MAAWEASWRQQPLRNEEAHELRAENRALREALEGTKLQQELAKYRRALQHVFDILDESTLTGLSTKQVDALAEEARAMLFS